MATEHVDAGAADTTGVRHPDVSSVNAKGLEDTAVLESVRDVLQASVTDIARRLPEVAVRIWVLGPGNVLQLAAHAGEDRWLQKRANVPFVGYPLTVGSRVLGVIAAFSPTELSDEATALLAGVADRVVVALEQHGIGRQINLQDRAIAASSNGIIISDPHRPDNPIIYASPGFERMTGYPSADIIGRNCRFLQGEDRDQEGVSELRAAVAEARGCRVVLRNYRKDGSLFYNELSLSPVTDAEGDLINFIGIQSDVTARELIQQERDELLQRVENALEVRDQFISIASHELRTPLTAIKAHAQFVERKLRRDGNLDAAARLQLIDRQATQMGALISDLLDVSQIESGHMTYAMHELDLGPLLDQVVEETRAAQPAFVVEWERDHGPFPVRADEVRIRQVATNLVSNAIKYSRSEPRLRITLRRVGEQAEFGVRDWGIGIPMDQQSSIFDQYFRAGNATESGLSGLGLGLHISHTIIDAHGGRLWFESEVGAGSTFYFTVPISSS